jgi:hypothetical protein
MAKLIVCLLYFIDNLSNLNYTLKEEYLQQNAHNSVYLLMNMIT